MDNPYAPPASKIEEERTTGSAIKAVTIGLLVDIGGSVVASTVLVAIYMATLAGSGMPAEDMAEAISAMSMDSWVAVLGMLVGCAFSVLGGYFCARIVRRTEYRIGNVMAAISVVIGFVLGFSAHSLFALVGLAFATWASVMTGVWLGVSRNRAA